MLSIARSSRLLARVQVEVGEQAFRRRLSTCGRSPALGAVLRPPAPVTRWPSSLKRASFLTSICMRSRPRPLLAAVALALAARASGEPVPVKHLSFRRALATRAHSGGQERASSRSPHRSINASSDASVAVCSTRSSGTVQEHDPAQSANVATGATSGARVAARPEGLPRSASQRGPVACDLAHEPLPASPSLRARSRSI